MTALPDNISQFKSAHDRAYDRYAPVYGDVGTALNRFASLSYSIRSLRQYKETAGISHRLQGLHRELQHLFVELQKELAK